MHAMENYEQNQSDHFDPIKLCLYNTQNIVKQREEMEQVGVI
jgi:hypothetical protein